MADDRGQPRTSSPTPTGHRLALFALALVVLVAAGGVVAWRRSEGAAGRCGPVATESIDPQSSQHLLPNSPEPDYHGDPPTSGPHQMGVALEGALDDPLTRPLQVGVLERGSVLVQYPTSLDQATVERLRALGTADVVVAPNPAITEVVATAWGHRLPCADADIPTLDQFIDQFAGQGPRMGVTR